VDVDPELRSLRNLNTPQDYETAIQELAANKRTDEAKDRC
jgi:hypothetical protein